MEPTKFSAKQLLIILGVGVLANVIASVIIHQIFKPKDTATTPPPVAKQGATTQTVTTVTPPVSEG
jgi:hypothetical protein